MQERVIERAPSWRDRIMGWIGVRPPQHAILRATVQIENDGMRTVGYWSTLPLPSHPEWVVTCAVADLVQGDQAIGEPRWYGFIGQMPGTWWAWDNMLSAKGRGYGAANCEKAIARLIAASNKE